MSIVEVKMNLLHVVLLVAVLLAAMFFITKTRAGNTGATS